jgi:hypothetical protein
MNSFQSAHTVIPPTRFEREVRGLCGLFAVTCVLIAPFAMRHNSGTAAALVTLALVLILCTLLITPRFSPRQVLASTAASASDALLASAPAALVLAIVQGTDLPTAIAQFLVAMAGFGGLVLYLWGTIGTTVFRKLAGTVDTQD